MAAEPREAEIFYDLGQSLRAQGKFSEAIDAFGQAISIRPNYAEAYNDLGNALQEKGRLNDAIIAYQRALAIRPDFAATENNLGVLFNRRGSLDEALAAFQRALRIRPQLGAAWGNLASALRERGEVDGALAAFRKAVEIQPTPCNASNLLYSMHFHPDAGPRELFEAHRAWDRDYAAELTASSPRPPIDPTSDRRLRIGYVSADFRNHPVGRFMLPLLANHDRTRFEVFCYSQSIRPDALTDRLRAHADSWRQTAGLNDAQLANLIRQDRIDLLVDLTMHMENSRLMAFARRPAPVQLTYLAYCSTTGLSAMDYRLSDPYLDPAGLDESVYTEKTVRLPRTYWCYEPPSDVTEIGELTAARCGFVTFGCLNSYAKVNPRVLEAWCEILRRTPRSRLIVHSPQGSHQAFARELFSSHGVDPGRLTFVGRMSPARYFQQYQQIDVGLDPFPYAGGTTTCDALWMGVPVVSLAGVSAVSRSGLSILTNVGLGALVAMSIEQYVQNAVSLAMDIDNLRRLRSGIRQQMRQSPLLDAPAFARDMEHAFEQMWNESLSCGNGAAF